MIVPPRRVLTPPDLVGRTGLGHLHDPVGRTGRGHLHDPVGRTRRNHLHDSETSATATFCNGHPRAETVSAASGERRLQFYLGGLVQP